jgi:hypothetical protein
MANWTIEFYGTLLKYQEEYVALKGDEEGRASVLRRCKVEIKASPKVSQQSIELPAHLLLVSSFPPYMKC